jgi:toxin ParE1/3/4
MAVLHKRARAKRDLVEHYVYLAEHAGIETAERFLLNADESFSDLSSPGIPGWAPRWPCAHRSWLACANGW